MYSYYIRDEKCIYCMENTDNLMVSPCLDFMSNKANSILGNKMARLRENCTI